MRNKPLYTSISYLLLLLKMYKVLIGRLPHEFLLLESTMLHVGYIWSRPTYTYRRNVLSFLTGIGIKIVHASESEIVDWPNLLFVRLAVLPSLKLTQARMHLLLKLLPRKMETTGYLMERNCGLRTQQSPEYGSSSQIFYHQTAKNQ